MKIPMVCFVNKNMDRGQAKQTGNATAHANMMHIATYTWIADNRNSQ
jgi:hypothetical protein